MLCVCVVCEYICVMCVCVSVYICVCVCVVCCVCVCISIYYYLVFKRLTNEDNGSKQNQQKSNDMHVYNESQLA